MSAITEITFHTPTNEVPTSTPPKHQEAIHLDENYDQNTMSCISNISNNSLWKVHNSGADNAQSGSNSNSRSTDSEGENDRIVPCQLATFSGVTPTQAPQAIRRRLNESTTEVRIVNLSSEDTIDTHSVPLPPSHTSSFLFTNNPNDNDSLIPPAPTRGQLFSSSSFHLDSSTTSSFDLEDRQLTTAFVEESKIDLSMSAINNEEQSKEEIEEIESSSPAQESEAIEIEVIQIGDEEDGLTEEERQRRQREGEERESQELIWQLMREEQMELYQMQMEYMQNTMEGMNEEDRRALEEAMRENNQVIAQLNQIQAAPAPVVPADGDQDVSGDGNAQDDEEAEEEEEEEENAWDYERLLALGQALGDVKTERWRMRAKQVIDALPKVVYKQITLRGSENVTEMATAQDISVSSDQGVQFVVPLDDEDKVEQVTSQPVTQAQQETFEKIYSRFQDYRCAVCMDNFETEDILHLLPCEHYFHCDCTTGWLADHNSCPICKVKVEASPQK